MLSYTRHAKKRMKERRISKKEVEFCLNNYHTTYTDVKGNPIYKAQLQSGKTIKVIVAANSVDPIKVITVADLT